ncbi:MAG: hypothetical protein OXI81_15830 [Paracoccaceae bacterium]|nr:hypothetical protein [Paracoccaceae bacterium]
MIETTPNAGTVRRALHPRHQFRRIDQFFALIVNAALEEQASVIEEARSIPGQDITERIMTVTVEANTRMKNLRRKVENRTRELAVMIGVLKTKDLDLCVLLEGRP